MSLGKCQVCGFNRNHKNHSNKCSQILQERRKNGAVLVDKTTVVLPYRKVIRANGACLKTEFI